MIAQKGEKMFKKLLKLLAPLTLCLALLVSVSARKPAPYTDYSSTTKPWNSAYATLTTYAEVCDGYYAAYQGGYWTKSLPLNYSASTGVIEHWGTSNGLKCQSTVKFTFGATSSPNYIVNTYHYYK